MLTQARYLIAVADAGSFTLAAAQLNVSQPALSQRIKQLEDVLGKQLIDRSGRAVKATDAGRAYIACMRRALREIENGRRVLDDVANLQSGTLRAAFLPLFTTYMVGPVVQAFHRCYPGVTVRVDILAQAQIEAALLDDHLDVGVAYSDTAPRDLAVAALHKQRLCLVVGEGHRAFRRRELDVGALSKTDLTLLGPRFVSRPIIDVYLKENGVEPRIAIECNSVEALVVIVQGGEIATILPEETAHRIPGLKAVQLRPPIPPRTVAILTRVDSYRSAASAAFISLLQEWDWAKGIPGRSRVV